MGGVILMYKYYPPKFLFLAPDLPTKGAGFEFYADRFDLLTQLMNA